MAYVCKSQERMGVIQLGVPPFRSSDPLPSPGATLQSAQSTDDTHACLTSAFFFSSAFFASLTWFSLLRRVGQDVDGVRGG